ncbi:hypothetical protein [Francisella philomiragia]|uniref:hypothetical protein n=1 Tax=Francisella philomiragia TaxID=28110 RepID=UPI003515EF5F
MTQISSDATSLKNSLNGYWIGPWGKRLNVKIFITIIDDYLSGYYLLDGKKYSFTGYVTVYKHGAKIIFDAPMSDDSGGFYNHKSKELRLFCGDRSYTYNKVNT